MEHGSRFAQGLRQDKLDLNLDRDRDRKINDLEMKWNMDAQVGQDLEWTLAKHSKKRKEMPGVGLEDLGEC